MKKLFLILSLSFFLFTFLFSLPNIGCPLLAQDSGTAVPVTDPRSQVIIGTNGELGAEWQPDPEVTFTGKLAARSQDVLNWLLKNYQWSSSVDQFSKLWEFTRNTVYAVLGLFILAGAFLMIITRGRSLTVRRFLIRFIMVMVLVWFSFSLVRTIYFLGDIVQGFFITKTDGTPIQTSDLLNVAFGYGEFIGFRRIGDLYNESAVTSLILIKTTSATYFTMFAILIIRKIILWFFILVSPIFPLLLFFKPIRNTAKIWIGEFFRWLLYAPLFALFLRGLVEIWSFSTGNKTGVPLNFDLLKSGTATSTPPDGVIYPTSINILLGGPGADVQLNNSVNYADTFVLYLVALLMLWVVIILPWILLRIFLDYFNNSNMGESNLVKFLAKNGSPLSPLINRYNPPPGVPPIGPTPPRSPSPGAAGLARSLPMTRFKHTPVAEINQIMQETAASEKAASQNMTSAMQSQISQIGEQSKAASQNLATGQFFVTDNLKIPDLKTQQANIEILGLTNLSIPTMKDIAKFETAALQHGGPAKEEFSRISEMLSRVAGTSSLVSPQEKERFSQIKEKLVVESDKGNQVAKSVVKAAAPVGAAIPDTNTVQQVNLDDYEEVKKTWQENYRKLEAPIGPDGKPMERKQWLQQEVHQIPTVIDLLLSGDPKQVEKGKQMVSKILPFLLLGGFSKAEIIAYLKAKLEAAKSVLNEVLAQESLQADEESKVEANRQGHAQASQTMAAEAPLPEEEKKNEINSVSNEPKTGTQN